MAGHHDLGMPDQIAGGASLNSAGTDDARLSFCRKRVVARSIKKTCVQIVHSMESDPFHLILTTCFTEMIWKGDIFHLCAKEHW